MTFKALKSAFLLVEGLVISLVLLVPFIFTLLISWADYSFIYLI